jgi:hypothetical protein
VGNHDLRQKSKERTMSEVDQNNEASVDGSPAGVPSNTIRNGMRTNNRIFNIRYMVILCSIVQGGSLANLKSPSISFGVGSISKTILLAVRAIYAQNEYIYFRVQGAKENTNHRE